jgi:two-component system sensor histidine kinase BaeS
MKLGVTAQLFAAVLASCAIVLLMYGIATEIGFQRGFLGYLNEQGRDRMEVVLPRLESAYREHGDWTFMRGELQGWFAFLPPEPDPARKGSGPPVSDQTGATNRFALLGPDFKVIVGHPLAGEDSIRKPVVVDGATVGWLAMVPFEKALGANDLRFAHEQRRMWGLVGALSVAVAALLAGLVSRTLLRRMHDLKDATDRMVIGQFATRVRDDARDELGELARDFNRMAAALEHNEGMRRNFMADISHELRTPLAVIRAEVEAIQDGIRPLAATSLEPVERHVRRLEKLVDDLHTLAVTDVGALSYERHPLDLATLLDATLTPLRARLTDAGLRLRLCVAPGPLRINGDERRLDQLFSNLLENSLRYTDLGGSVEINCTREGAQFVVVFDDSAPTVHPDKLPRLFERFYRADQGDPGTNRGSGLGLAICRNIVEAHGGTIQATMSWLGGLRVTIVLPEAS